jgi:DNA-binding response OmpR family regulator
MMVTAYDDEARKRRASDMGASQFLAKPVDFNHLGAQLRLLADAVD